MDDIRTPLTKVEDLARILDHSMLEPSWSEERMLAACREARRLGVGAVTVRPGDVEAAVRALESSGVVVGSVAGYPYGWSTTAVKLYEARDLARRGAREITVPLSTAKLVSRQFLHLEQELLQLAGDCRAAGATLKALVDPAALSEELAIVAGKICKRTETAWVVLAAPPAGSSREMEAAAIGRLKTRVAVEAFGAGDLDAALSLYEAGCGRLGTTNPGPLLAAWRARVEQMAKAGPGSRPAS